MYLLIIRGDNGCQSFGFQDILELYSSKGLLAKAVDIHGKWAKKTFGDAVPEIEFYDIPVDHISEPILIDVEDMLQELIDKFGKKPKKQKG